MTKTMTDLKNYVADLQRNGQVSSIAETLASDVRRRMAENLTERELVGIDYLNTFIYDEDPLVCGSHDYVDANMVVFDAVADFSERVVGIPRDVFIENALTAEEVQDADGAVLTLIRTGWDEVKKQGFSNLWRETADDDLRKNLGLLVLTVPSSATSGHALQEEISSDFDEAYERIVGASPELRELADKLEDSESNPDAVQAFVEAVKSAQAPSPAL
ncbi:hypothetical protein [Rhizobium sp. MHM7A]|uniref:hypothetical protein n=1 Tax=Rhizobium sp. MHM7A TaxID=2583233 RepID=UPI00110678AE|nr:hypothetical protein [Rhizobium sp. MHM7A]TLX16117.1 hypothetical protein FFR93_01990 [Rhizobium sp. MHM7A]